MYTNSCCNFTIHVEEFLKFHNNTVIENYQIKNRLPRKLFALRINLFEFHIIIWRTGLFLELFYACNYFCRHHVLLDIVNIFTTNVERTIPFSSHSATKHWNCLSSPKPSSCSSTTKVSKTLYRVCPHGFKCRTLSRTHKKRHITIKTHMLTSYRNVLRVLIKSYQVMYHKSL